MADGDSAPDTPPGHAPGALARRRNRWALLAAMVLVAGLLAYALTRLDWGRAWHTLISASPGWIVLALVLMGGSLLLRSLSWYQTLEAALPETRIGWTPVARATMIGVMASALFP